MTYIAEKGTQGSRRVSYLPREVELVRTKTVTLAAWLQSRHVQHPTPYGVNSSPVRERVPRLRGPWNVQGCSSEQVTEVGPLSDPSPSNAYNSYKQPPVLPLRQLPHGTQSLSDAVAWGCSGSSPACFQCIQL